MSLRVRVISDDMVRRHGLTSLLAEAGHVVSDEAPDAVLCDGAAATMPPETEAPVLVLADASPRHAPAGLLPRDASPEQIDLALRAIAGGLVVRAAIAGPGPVGFGPAADDSPLTPRETEILTLVGQGMSNKAVARRLGISVHTVKFHLEALFAKLEASSRAEAVAKGLMGGAIEL